LAEDAIRLEVGVRDSEVVVVDIYGDLLAEDHGAELAEGLCYGEKFLFGGCILALGGI